LPALELVDVTKKTGVESAYVTDSDGHLVGIVGRHSLEQVLSAARQADPLHAEG
jgi:hypothetical protein